MKVWHSPYELRVRQSLSCRMQSSKRRGALLMVDRGDGQVGYSDCHPWTELGDLPLREQLESLVHGNPTELIQCSVTFALEDGAARAEGRSLFEGLKIPKSHKLVTQITEKIMEKTMAQIGEAEQEGFSTFKVKVGRDCNVEARSLNQISQEISSESKLRLDANERFSEEEFDWFLSQLSQECLNHLEWIEDPFVFCWARWSLYFRKVGLAIDAGAGQWLSSRLSKEVSGEISEEIGRVQEGPCVVIKPAKLDQKKIAAAFSLPSRTVLTSYMDHPVGQMGAAYVAALCKKRHPDWKETCGLITHDLYEAEDFGEQMKSQGSHLLPVEGNGIGFDELFDRQSWLRLV